MTTDVRKVADLTLSQMGDVVRIEERSFVEPWTMTDFRLLVNDDRALNVGIREVERLVGYALGPGSF